MSSTSAKTTNDAGSETDNDTDNVEQLENQIDSICERLAKNQRVRRTLPGEGRLRIDRQLPFLCVYRSPPNAKDPGTQKLVTSTAAYLFLPGGEQYGSQVSELCHRISALMSEHFGTFLFIELWVQPNDDEFVQDNSEELTELPLLQPAFTIVTDENEHLPRTVKALRRALSEVTIGGLSAQVEIRSAEDVSPPSLPSLTSGFPDDEQSESFVLGIAIRPIFRDLATSTLFPQVLHSLRLQMAKALRVAIAEFAEFEPLEGDPHFDSLGPTSLVKAARLVDQQLCEVSSSFDFLLQVTPINADEAWQQFQRDEYQEEPIFSYRPLPYDPNLLKRRLYNIEIERIEDPTLGQLFWEQQEEIDRQLTALRDLNTPNFLYGSLQIYGAADDKLVEVAHAILNRYPSPTQSNDDSPSVGAKKFAAKAREEIDHYHAKLPEFNAAVEICDHIASGIMVSQGKLLVAESLSLRAERVQPLLHHEIGTHLVTYFNGRCQPFRQLYAGLAGYDELQEGLAVLAEYLSKGLTINRLRSLAARVVAVRKMCEGYTFVDTFQHLHGQWNFTARQAFTTTLRVFRGGGLTKDVIYLRGLLDVLAYLADGHDIEPLYVGKFGLHHLPYIQEMRRRGILEAPGVLPRFWHDEDLRNRLERCRGLSILELMENEA